MNVTGATNALVARGQVGRGQRTLAQLWQVPTFFAGVLAFLCVAASASYRAELRDGPFGVALNRLRQGLREPTQPKELIDLAEALLVDVRQHPRREGETVFLAGSAYFRIAETSSKHVAAQTKALEYLEKALQIGVPQADVPALHHRLGVMLYRQGDDVPRAVALMAQSIGEGADEPRQAYALLAEAQLRLPAPDVDAALAAAQKLLELADNPEALAQARYLRGELLLRKEQRLEALKELDRISGDISPALRIKTRLLQARTCQDEGLWHRAAACWKELLADAANVPGGKGFVLLSQGHCLANAEPPSFAAAAAAWRSALELGGPEGQAAGLRLGELDLWLPPGDPAQALTAWTLALHPVRTARDYHNPHLDLDKARELFERACRHFIDAGLFERAQETAELYKKLAPAGVAEERWAQAVEAQAQELQKSAPAENAALRGKIHALFHRAGVAYEQAALTRLEHDPLEPSWRAARCYLAAADYARAAAALERFVALAKDEPRLAEAWFSLAETQVALHHKEQARQAYYKCMEFPATPYASRARYQLALEEIERKNFKHAKEILKQNLTVASPSVDRESHEKSLYKMAGLLLLMQAYDEAIWYLKEASRQYPNNANALIARDRLADCYALLAEHTQRKIQELESVNLETMSPERRAALEEMRAHQQRTQRQWLQQAGAVYQSLADELKERGTTRPLTKDESIMLRKALFGIAERHFDMNNFTEALRLYKVLQQDYSKQVESLFACLGIWKCVGVMVESPEQMRLARAAAASSIQLARADLDSLPADSEFFRGEGVWTKDNWLSWLDWVQAQLNPPAAPATRLNPLLN
jgi:tetratricopeptide (TPR) repeat protein